MLRIHSSLSKSVSLKFFLSISIKFTSLEIESNKYPHVLRLIVKLKLLSSSILSKIYSSLPISIFTLCLAFIAIKNSSNASALLTLMMKFSYMLLYL